MSLYLSLEARVFRLLFLVHCAALSSVLCAAASAPPPAAAAAAPLDLGQGLAYVRLHRLPDDLAVLKAAWTAPALIVDARYPAGGAPEAGLDLPPRPRTAPLFVLVGADAPAGLLAVLRRSASAVITLGVAKPGLVPDIALDVKPELDRRAYDALGAGVPLDSLIGETIIPARFNEAALAREHENGGPEDSDQVAESGVRSDVAPDGAAPAPPGSAAAGAAAKPAEPPPLKDVVLERAVQLHRALRALGLLPPR